MARSSASAVQDSGVRSDACGGGGDGGDGGDGGSGDGGANGGGGEGPRSRSTGNHCGGTATG